VVLLLQATIMAGFFDLKINTLINSITAIDPLGFTITVAQWMLPCTAFF